MSGHARGEGTLRRRTVRVANDAPGVACSAGRAAAGADADALVHSADAAVADVLDGAAEVAVEFGALLAAGLEHDVVVARRLHHRARFGDRQRQRLFAIDVLASASGEDRGDGVPVIRRADDDGVDIAAIQQFAEIDVCGATAIGAGLAFLGVGTMHALDGVLAANAVHVADGDDLRAAVAEEALEMSAIHHADADEAEIDAAVGPRPWRSWAVIFESRMNGAASPAMRSEELRRLIVVMESRPKRMLSIAMVMVMANARHCQRISFACLLNAEGVCSGQAHAFGG